MRIISKRTLRRFWELYPTAEQPLKSWYDEATKAHWNTPQELKSQYASASIISAKRVVFNIGGNHYRMVVDIEYRLQIIFIVWVGTHNAYDELDISTLEYETD